MDEAILAIINFDHYQRTLADTLTATERVPYVVTVSGEDTKRMEVPTSRRAKICARALPWNPYFKRAATEARQLLSIPPDGLPAGDDSGYNGSVRLGLAMNAVIIPYLWALW